MSPERAKQVYVQLIQATGSFDPYRFATEVERELRASYAELTGDVEPEQLRGAVAHFQQQLHISLEAQRELERQLETSKRDNSALVERLGDSRRLVKDANNERIHALHELAGVAGTINGCIHALTHRGNEPETVHSVAQKLGSVSKKAEKAASDLATNPSNDQVEIAIDEILSQKLSDREALRTAILVGHKLVGPPTRK